MQKKLFLAAVLLFAALVMFFGCIGGNEQLRAEIRTNLSNYNLTVQSNLQKVTTGFHELEVATGDRDAETLMSRSSSAKSDLADLRSSLTTYCNYLSAQAPNLDASEVAADNESCKLLSADTTCLSPLADAYYDYGRFGRQLTSQNFLTASETLGDDCRQEESHFTSLSSPCGNSGATAMVLGGSYNTPTVVGEMCGDIDSLLALRTNYLDANASMQSGTFKFIQAADLCSASQYLLCEAKYNESKADFINSVSKFNDTCSRMNALMPKIRTMVSNSSMQKVQRGCEGYGLIINSCIIATIDTMIETARYSNISSNMTDQEVCESTHLSRCFTIGNGFMTTINNCNNLLSNYTDLGISPMPTSAATNFLIVCRALNATCVSYGYGG